MVETQQKRLAELIGEGIKEGYGYDKIARNIRKEFDQFSRDQVKTIVRTEVTRTTNYGVLDAYLQSGIVEAKKWFTALDDRVCELCAPLEGKIASVSQAFIDPKTGEKLHTKYDGDIIAPPRHVRCRCTVVPEIIEINAKKADTELEKIQTLKKLKDKINKIKNG